jgi:hypothetical protein
MDSFAAIIDRIGVADLASALGLPESHIRTMKARDSIPPDYWPQLIDIAAAREIEGINWLSLVSLRKARSPERLAG